MSPASTPQAPHSTLARALPYDSWLLGPQASLKDLRVACCSLCPLCLPFYHPRPELVRTPSNHSPKQDSLPPTYPAHSPTAQPSTHQRPNVTASVTKAMTQRCQQSELSAGVRALAPAHSYPLSSMGGRNQRTGEYKGFNPNTHRCEGFFLYTRD